ncbi:MAG: alpha/beta fold hydrolase [Negativicutes bacterium]|nr:alpha/beta fold hydrolase [Negativicutes bacterium]MDR3592833.1 alpha/beta fold hydrolase [Negativicutes bacterium]
MKFPAFRLTVALITLFLFALVAAPSALAAEERVGVVLLHGKTGSPGIFSGGVVEPLKQAGFLVETPEMSWSRGRYIDKTYDEALNEIDAAAARLAARGATKIVIAGHSMGGDAALAYGAYHGNIAAVILLAPGHIPDWPGMKRDFADGVARAKAMVDAGHGNDFASFPDTNMGKDYVRTMKAAIYFSFFDPDGVGAAAKNATNLSPAIPVLYVAGSADPLTRLMGQSFIFSKLPPNPLTKYVVVEADHLGTPAAAVGEMIPWLRALAQ